MTENSSPEPVDLIYLDEASMRPIAVEAKAFAKFEAAIDRGLTELLARWELRERNPASGRRAARGGSKG